MILASAVFTAIRAHLDDDNSGRYTVTDDLSPVVNAAINYLIAVFNAGFEQKKIYPESLRELVRVEIVPATGSGNTKRADVTSICENLWTILGVEPDAEATEGATTTTLAPEEFAGLRSKFAKRLTLEEWEEKNDDPFSPGTSQTIPSVFLRPAYLGPGRYFDADHDFIFIRPASLVTDNVGIWYLKNPTVVTSTASEIEFPQSLFQLLVDKALGYISLQHGNDSKYGQNVEKDLLQLIQIMGS